MIGSTDELITKLVLAHEILGVDRVFGQIDWGGMPRGLVQDSIARYASEIAPAVRAAPPPPAELPIRLRREQKGAGPHH
jgi:hypothetical protein